MNLSVVIASYKDEACLYLTTASLLAQLQNYDGGAWEILIVADGGSAQKWEALHPKVHCIRLTGGNRTGSPQGTRDFGIRQAKYRNVLCIESHVVVDNVLEFVQEHERLHSSISFCPRKGEGPDMIYVPNHLMDWDRFWYKNGTEARFEPYQVATFGHACFIVDKFFYEQTGGYTNLLQGFGGEEPLLNLKTWMLGGSVWMIPSAHHYHYLTPGAHVESLHTEDFKRNFLTAAYIIGGREQLERTSRSLSGQLRITSQIEAERRRICEGPFGGNIETLKEFFKANQILA